MNHLAQSWSEHSVPLAEETQEQLLFFFKATYF